MEEVTIADVYAVLKRWRLMILGLVLGGTLLTFAVASALPKVYVSKTVLSLSAPPQSNPGAEVSDQLLANLPSVAGLARGFGDLLTTKRVSEVLAVPAPSGDLNASFDEKTGLMTLNADGGTPEDASKNASQLLAVAKRFFETRIVQGMLGNAQSMLSRATLDRDTALRSLQGLRATTGVVPGGSGDAATSAGLEERGVRPPVARANNAAAVDLSLEVSSLQTQVAKTEARIYSLQALIKSPQRLEQLVGQAIRVQELVPVTVPLRPDSPRPLFYAALAGALALLLGFLIPFLVEAVRMPNPNVGQRLEGVPLVPERQG